MTATSSAPRPRAHWGRIGWCEGYRFDFFAKIYGYEPPSSDEPADELKDKPEEEAAEDTAEEAAADSTEEYGNDLIGKHESVSRSAFPKSKDHWYSIVVDDSFTNEEVERILEDAFAMAK